jgi:hypothetical protein
LFASLARTPGRGAAPLFQFADSTD